MLKDLLEKFDKEFENKARDWTAAQKGACACLGNCDKCGFHRCHGCLCSFKSLAHSHIEAAYRVGMNIWLSVQDLYQEGFKVGKQSNLEKLIEKCGDRFGSLDHLSNGTWRAKMWYSDEEAFGSTPTEAVENLFKAFNKQ